MGKCMPTIRQNEQEKKINETFINILKVNFKYNSELNNSELIFEKSILKKQLPKGKIEKKPSKKYITKGKKIELYNVFDLKTKNAEGILYIKTLKDSKFIKSLFLENKSVILDCKFNTEKMKWEAYIK